VLEFTTTGNDSSMYTIP